MAARQLKATKKAVPAARKTPARTAVGKPNAVAAARKTPAQRTAAKPKAATSAPKPAPMTVTNGSEEVANYHRDPTVACRSVKHELLQRNLPPDPRFRLAISRAPSAVGTRELWPLTHGRRAARNPFRPCRPFHPFHHPAACRAHPWAPDCRPPSPRS